MTSQNNSQKTGWARTLYSYVLVGGCFLLFVLLMIWGFYARKSLSWLVDRFFELLG